ncbi:MAG: efflux RND transporter periplasmic adaptor subunit [Thermoguttaceae bacterium]
MSEQALDPQLIEQTKQQIRLLVNEIAQLSKSSLSPEEFYGEFLPRVVSALAAIGGAIWTVEEQGRLALQYQINLQQTKLRESEEAQMQHGRLLHKALTSDEPILVPPHSGSGESDEAANPTDFLLVLGPLKTELETIGVVEVFQRPDSGPNTQKGYLRFLKQMTELAGDFFKSRQLRHFGDRQVLWSQLEEFTRVIHTSLDPRETAYMIANEGRRLIECDRVSVAIRRGNKCRIESVSGQDLFDKRSNTVRLLGELATAVVASEEPMWYSGDTSNMAPQVEDAVQEYVDDSHSKTVAVLPLFPPGSEVEEDDPDKREDSPSPIGALIVEQIEDARIPQRMIQRVDVVAKHSATALHNSLEHNSLFLMPVWRAIGKQRWILRARTLPKTIAIAVTVLVALVALCVVPYPFKAQCPGNLQPVERRKVFAGLDGRVVEINVTHESKVVAPKPDQGIDGTVLARLESSDLEIKIEENQGKLATTTEQLDTVIRELNDPRKPAEEKRQLMGKKEELQKSLESLRLQEALFRKQEQELDVRSPIDGEIITWDLDKRLRFRPVQRGNLLMEVADTEGPWQLELRMPEKRMGHIDRYLDSLREKDPKASLPVEFILATHPNKTYHGRVIEINERAEVRNEDGVVVLIKVDLEGKEQLPAHLRPGSEVSAKIMCGYMPVGYVLLCDAIAYVQKNILFRF